jgi:uncharacterized protein (TIGR01777 family)
MKVLIAGGTGFLGRHLTNSLIADSHQVWMLSRNPNKNITAAQIVLWDGQTTDGWGHLVEEIDAVVNLSGLSLHSWPWTKNKKRRFHDSRVKPGLALASAIKNASQRPAVFIQISGINHYGLRGDGIADESTPPGDDYLAQLTVAWEEATKTVEDVGVRHIVCRTAVVLARDAILMWLMALPVRLYFGGRFGTGEQAMPWIHVDDQIGAIRYLMENSNTKSAYNLIAPQATSNDEFMRTLAKVLRRPYWFPVPAALMHLALGEMSVLVTEGRFARPKRLLEQGYTFRFPKLESALKDIFIE